MCCLPRIIQTSCSSFPCTSTSQCMTVSCQWLTITARIRFKTLLEYKAVKGQATSYICSPIKTPRTITKVASHHRIILSVFVYYRIILYVSIKCYVPKWIIWELMCTFILSIVGPSIHWWYLLDWSQKRLSMNLYKFWIHFYYTTHTFWNLKTLVTIT